MIAYKLCRLLKNGDITPLFIDKTRRLPFDKWLTAESHLTAGFAFRPGWHCVSTMDAPHLSKRGRVWVEVEIDEYEVMSRSKHQGGLWYLANKIKFIRIV